MAVVYPERAYQFVVRAGLSQISFSEVSGLTVEREKIEYRGGASKEISKISMPGMEKHSDVTLSRGVVVGDNELFEWFNTAAVTQTERRDITISLLNEALVPTMTWKIKNAYPLKVEGPGLKADGNEIAIEKIVLAHEGMVMENLSV
jgi:phage tail-like protein